jgi:hypothetical protein
MNRVAAAAVTGALVSGAVMYAVGARTQVSAFTPPTASQLPAAQQAAIEPAALRQAETVSVQRVADTSLPRRTSRPASVQERTIVREAPARRDERSWGKTAMVIGGSAASGAAVGGIVDGKKGALIGAAIGGGAASIYEATRRR